MNRLASEREDAGLQSSSSPSSRSAISANSSLEFIDAIGNWGCKCGARVAPPAKPCTCVGNMLIADPYGDGKSLCPRCVANIVEGDICDIGNTVALKLKCDVDECQGAA
jgi:hypothetical protein